MKGLQQGLRRMPPWIWPWALTAMALLAAASAALWLTPHWQQEAKNHQAAAAQARNFEATARRREWTLASAWRDSLATAAQRDARLTALLDAATQSDLALLNAEQASDETAVDGVSRQRLSLNLRGPYVGLRRFVETVLLTDPGLTVERISFTRNRAEDPLLEARIQLSLVQRETTEASR